MNVKLSPEVEAMILREMRSGRYDDVEQLLHKALSLLQTRDSEQHLREELCRGFAQISSGESTSYEPGTMDELKREASANASARKPVKDVIKP